MLTGFSIPPIDEKRLKDGYDKEDILIYLLVHNIARMQVLTEALHEGADPEKPPSGIKNFNRYINEYEDKIYSDILERFFRRDYIRT